MKRHLVIELENCGDELCSVRPGVFCTRLLTKRMGTMWVCGLFRDENGSEIELRDTNGDGTGSLMRCPECLAAEERPVTGRPCEHCGGTRRVVSEVTPDGVEYEACPVCTVPNPCGEIPLTDGLVSDRHADGTLRVTATEGRPMVKLRAVGEPGNSMRQLIKDRERV